MKKLRCVECGEFHEGECDKSAKLAFMMDCGLDALDEYLGLPAEPGSRRWMIARGEYPSNRYPSQLEAHLTKYAPDVASVPSAEPDSGLESVPAVESDTQPRG